MKKKYYYDCLIKALYMNKEFGVKFYTAFKSDFLDKELGFSRVPTPRISKKKESKILN